MGQAIRVLIVDDHAIVRKGIRALLTEIDGLEVVGEAADGLAAITQAETLRPDVILMDLDMPRLDGIEATRQIKASQPESRILVMTGFVSDDKMLPAIKAGALGYLLKESAPEDLVQGIYQLHRGESALHPSVARKVLDEITHPSADRQPVSNPLTERETEVLLLVTQGLSNSSIARKLKVSDVTVRLHVRNILSKLHVATRIQAVLYALREGLVTLDASGEDG